MTMPEPSPGDPTARTGAVPGQEEGLCRDCRRDVPPTARTCPSCRSARLVFHPSLNSLAVAHMDCDAFFAAVEKRDDPSLASRPVIVGGGKRGVVSTCCYIARSYGVRSAMPMFQALKACPEAVVLRPRMDAYVREARRIRSLLHELTPLVETVSIDEAYLDLSGTQRLHKASPARLMMELQARIELEMGLTVSIGIASNRFLAKLASEADKPRGFYALSELEAPQWLAGRPVSVIGGVGKTLTARLAEEGLVRIADLQAMSRETLMRRHGEMGRRLHERAWGRDATPITPGGDRRSVSSETTFGQDTADPSFLEDALYGLCEQTSARAKAHGVEGRVVTLKLKTARFQTVTRRRTLHSPTQLARILFQTCLHLLQAEPFGVRYRLIGVGLSDLSPAGDDRLDLAEPASLKRAAAERAADAVRSRFGSGSATTGRGMRLRSRKSTT